MECGRWKLELMVSRRGLTLLRSSVCRWLLRLRPVPKQITLDDIYKTLGPSVVWIGKLDGTGRRTDLATGFVLEPNVIATSFQAIDSAVRLEIEFADGRKGETDEVLGFSRNADWALLKNRHPFPCLQFYLGDPSAVPVGEHLAAFNVDGGTRVLGTVDIGGQGV